ncbi:MAG: ATP-binding protein [Acidobacteriota bacterium]
MLKSLRARLFLVAILWMTGLLLAVNWLALAFINHHPAAHLRFVAHYSALALAAVGFAVGGAFLVNMALAPLRDLRRRLSAVRQGSERRVHGRYPSEIQPLVDDLNALLDDRDQALERAHKTAGDLAHGLKTPLAVLTHEAGRAVRAGQAELAAAIRNEVERMRRQVDYHLAHARATASAGTAPGLTCPVAESAQALARTLLRLHDDRGLTLDISAVPPDLVIRGRREDLDEMLGNVMDNACKWARSRVTVSARMAASIVVIVIDDDGPGLDPALRESVLQRGIRADEALPGYGLGLAIVRDLAELYGGTISLGDSPLGGMRATLELLGGAGSPND